MLVAPDATQNDVVLLSSLKRVDTRYFDILVQVLLQRAAELHVTDDVRPLAFVRSNDSDLTRDHAGLKELCDNFLHV